MIRTHDRRACRTRGGARQPVGSAGSGMDAGDGTGAAVRRRRRGHRRRPRARRSGHAVLRVRLEELPHQPAGVGAERVGEAAAEGARAFSMMEGSHRVPARFPFGASGKGGGPWRRPTAPICGSGSCGRSRRARRRGPPACGSRSRRPRRSAGPRRGASAASSGRNPAGVRRRAASSTGTRASCSTSSSSSRTSPCARSPSVWPTSAG